MPHSNQLAILIWLNISQVIALCIIASKIH